VRGGREADSGLHRQACAQHAIRLNKLGPDIVCCKGCGWSPYASINTPFHRLNPPLRPSLDSSPPRLIGAVRNARFETITSNNSFRFNAACVKDHCSSQCPIAKHCLASASSTTSHQPTLSALRITHILVPQSELHYTCSKSNTDCLVIESTGYSAPLHNLCHPTRQLPTSFTHTLAVHVVGRPKSLVFPERPTFPNLNIDIKRSWGSRHMSGRI
jgi:hypothetical protein